MFTAKKKVRVGHRDHRAVLKRAFALFLFATVIGLQAATQYMAAVLDYAPQLGLRVGEVFPPWGVLLWALKWHAPFAAWFEMAAEVGVGAWGVTIFVVVWLWPKRKVTDSLHGSARWARYREVCQAGLLRADRGDSVVVGGYRDAIGRRHYLRHNGIENVLCFGPPRSGKGAGLVVPTLLSFQGSAFVTDLRGELYQLTAGYRRSSLQRVLRFAPAETDSVAWNPLDEIRHGTVHETADVQLVAHMLLEAEAVKTAGTNTDYFMKRARMWLTGLILYAIHEDDYRVSFARLDELLNSGERAQLWEKMSESRHAIVRRTGRDALQTPDKEAASTINSLLVCLELYRDPVVAKNTARCDFRVRDLMHKAKPHTLYLITQPADKDRLLPLIRMLISMTVRILAAEVAFQDGQPVDHYRHRLLLLLDEFPALGKLDILTESLAFLGGYGITAYLICQDTVQFKGTYGTDEGKISAACHIHVAFPPNRVETAREIVARLGKTTVEYKSPSQSYGHGQGQRQQSTRTTHWAGRDLLTVDEVLSLPGPRKVGKKIVRRGHMLIFVAGKAPIYGEQPLYFFDRKLSARAAIPAAERPHLRLVTSAS